MVRIEERSLEERTGEERMGHLMDITKRIIEKEHKVIDWGRYAFTVSDGNEQPIYVDALNKKVYVKKREYESLGLKLAEIYEKECEEEFTLKREY